MTHEMTEEQIERQQIENVFCLGGGELHEKNAEFPDEWTVSLRTGTRVRPTTLKS